ncbi:hypothetical protein [Streptomyces sp. ISID311]|uniref:hypothetical protein n=1 Tax=Streptomyces sp. ISID311 TaxID=2601673 RepID=UPI0011BD36E8|nr:hypothetical protein [Streptomyces sp. ISID311]TXC99944.1 hypothetical protein FS847_01445 [Streptomyces sp. ISID311]
MVGVTLAFEALLWMAVRFGLRCHRLGRSVTAFGGPEAIDATVDGRRIRLTPQQVARITVRPIETRLGRPTSHAAVQALVHHGVALPRSSRVGRDGWVVVPLDRMYPLTPGLSAALEAFGGPRWELPLIDA